MKTPDFFSAAIGVVIGMCFSLVLLNLGGGGTLTDARRKYNRCIEDGGSRDRCVDRYLLKIERKTP